MAYPPRNLLGAFGEVFGYPKAVAKQCARECSVELANVADWSLLDGCVITMFAEDSCTRDQWEQFGIDPDTSITDYTELFYDLLMYALTSIIEVRIEGDHRGAKLEAQKCAGPIKPATMCARLRRPHAMTCLDDPACVYFLIANWRKHTLWRQLLSHRLDGPTVDRLSFSEKCGVVYGFRLEDQFDPDADTKPLYPQLEDNVLSRHKVTTSTRLAIDAWSKVVSATRVKQEVLPSPVGLVVEYWRARL